ncbi:MAG: DNA repair protein RecO [Bacteroidales bacterium]
MISKSQIIVLHTIKHSDTGVVVQAYSNTLGRCAVYYRSGGKQNKNLSELHPLNILDIITYSNQGPAMPNIREMTPVENMRSIVTDIRKNAIAIFMSELLTKSIREIEPNADLYTFLSSSILVLNSLPKGVENFHLHFLVHYCKILGFMPLDNYNLTNKYFDFFRAEYTNLYDKVSCFTERQSFLLHNILTTPVKKIDNISCSGIERADFIKSLLDYLSYHLGWNLEIKSLPVLHEIFA